MPNPILPLWECIPDGEPRQTIHFMEDFKKDFEPIEYKERFFFTDSMVDEYIQWAVQLCKKELEALMESAYYFDEYEWSWGK